MKRMEDFLQGKRRALIAGSAFFVLLIMVDASTSSELNLSPLYLAPVLLVTWYVGTAWGASFAVAAILVSVVIGIWAGHHYSHAFYFYFHLAGKVFSLLVFLWVVKLAARLRLAHDLERTHARTDFLTGIANRAAFFEALAKEIERDRRHHHPFTLIFLDCDNFKTVNDQLGHAIGDGLLRVVAATLVSAVRKTDLVARLGGDEFVVLMPETDAEQCGELVMHLNDRLDDAMRGNKWPVSFSIGVAIFPHSPDSVDQAIEFADSLMYQSKNAGKHPMPLNRSWPGGHPHPCKSRAAMNGSTGSSPSDQTPGLRYPARGRGRLRESQRVLHGELALSEEAAGKDRLDV